MDVWCWFGPWKTDVSPQCEMGFPLPVLIPKQLGLGSTKTCQHFCFELSTHRVLNNSLRVHVRRRQNRNLVWDLLKPVSTFALSCQLTVYLTTPSASTCAAARIVNDSAAPSDVSPPCSTCTSQ
jgi:hypothetical protein